MARPSKNGLLGIALLCLDWELDWPGLIRQCLGCCLVSLSFLICALAFNACDMERHAVYVSIMLCIVFIPILRVCINE